MTVNLFALRQVEKFRLTIAALTDILNNSLKDIVIRLQQELIGTLHLITLESNVSPDFLGMANTSDLSPTQTVNTLQYLFQRLSVAARVSSTLLSLQ